MFDNNIKLKDTKIYDFLKDYEENVEIFVLEESKQKKSELIEVAKKKGILIEGSFDLAIIKMVYVFPDEANGNRIRVPKDELLKKLPTLIGKPLNLDHVRRYTIGYFIDYRYIEKENKVIAYAIIFKEIFKNEWKQLLTLLKKKKLTNSYEIWSDKKLTEANPDGTKTLHNLQIGGGAIIWKEKPAFEDAYVLETAKKSLENSQEMELVYACLNKKELCLGNCNVCKKCNHKEMELVTSAEGVAEIQKPAPIKIVCSNCGRNFEYSFVVGQISNQIKCTNCFAVLDSTGKMIYPPQLKNFNFSCPGCRNTNNWLILSKNDENETIKIKCLSCAKEYNMKFKPEGIQSKIIKQLMFLRIGIVPCLQCGRRNDFTAPSNQKIIHIKCKKCELSYSFDVENKKVRTIESYEEVKIDNKEKNSKEEATMELKFSKEEIDILEKDCVEWTLADAKLAYETRKKYPDSVFAVVKTVKDKKTGGTRKIRKYPLNNKDEVRSALRYLGMPRNKEALRKIGISPISVLRKILKRAKVLGMKELLQRREQTVEKSKLRKVLRKAVNKIKISRKESELVKASLENRTSKIEKFVGGIKKFANKIRGLRGKVKGFKLEIASLLKKVEETKKFYLENANKIAERRAKLTDSKLTDKQVLNDKDFELAIAKQTLAEKEIIEKKNAKRLTTASLHVGDKNKDGDSYAKFRKGVNENAFPKKNPDEQL